MSFKDKYADSTSLFCKLKILENGLVYECRIDEPLRSLSDFFVPIYSLYNHNTRQVSEGNIFSPRVNTTLYGKRSAKYAGAILWNNLQPVIKESCFANVVKKKLHD